MQDSIWYVPNCKSLISAKPTGYKTKNGDIELISDVDYPKLKIKKGETFLLNEITENLIAR